MDLIALAKSLSDLGGWAVVLVIGVVILVGGARRWWVFGWIFDRLEKRAETSDTQTERLTAAFEGQAKTLTDLAESFKVMARSYDRIENRLDALERRRVKDD